MFILALETCRQLHKSRAVAQHHAHTRSRPHIIYIPLFLPPSPIDSWAAKQEEWEEKTKLANQFRALEEDEIMFLDSLGSIKDWKNTNAESVMAKS
jgi:hypothetical protein